jgi:uncharacterized glyoxalase superfamily protein PhnB
MAVKAIPDGYHAVTPALVVNGAAKQIDFIKQAFAGEELFRMPGPGGKIMHAEVRIGDSILMLNDVFEQMQATAASLFLYVTDVDAVYNRAVQAGATSSMEPADMFWGDRMGQVTDAFGNRWSIATHKEDVSPEDMQKRMNAVMNQQA